MIITLDCPEYTLEKDLNLQLVAASIDKKLIDNFDNKNIVLRALSSSEHNMPKQQLLATIEKLGYDRYDHEREGDRYKNIEDKQIDFFGQKCIVSENLPLSLPLLEGFHIYGAQFHGKPAPKMDIWLVYDENQLQEVMHQYEGRDDQKRDGFVFKVPNKKPAALLGILSIN